jgi:membrane protein DedA with SNARE-associated domain
MEQSIEFVLRHGYLVLFVAVFAEQIGLPVPSTPVLLAAGVLVGAGELSLFWAMLVAVSAALITDFIWYELGRHRGHSILNLLCRISLEPDSCVRRTENTFLRHGPRALLFAKFVPGLNTAAPPLAGMFRMSLTRFLAWDAAGAVLWIGAFGGAGYLFSEQLEWLAAAGLRLGSWLLVLLAGGLAAFLAWKYVHRRRFLRELRVARIQPRDLFGRLQAGGDLLVLDLRHSIELGPGAVKIPGALQILPEDIEERHVEVPRDREIALYCT